MQAAMRPAILLGTYAAQFLSFGKKGVPGDIVTKLNAALGLLHKHMA
jgi:hypothetical protein